MRYSNSPEHLKIGGVTYTPQSPNASTFLILGNVVVHSREFHMTILNGLSAMSSATDMKTAQVYDMEFSSPLSQSTLDSYKENRVNILGVDRINNKAGRVWKNVQTEHGGIFSVISFWGGESTIEVSDLERLRETFELSTEVIVEYQGRPDCVILPAYPG